MPSGPVPAAAGAGEAASAAPVGSVEPPSLAAAATTVGAPPATAPATAPATVRYGGFWRRCVAFFIDGILLGITGALIQVGMGVGFLEPEWSDPRAGFSNLASVVIGWLYCALLESSARQATLGQQVLGIQVTDLRHRRISFARATGRHFAQIVSVLTALIGYLMIAFTAKQQALHDKLAGCLVVRAD